MLIVVAFLMWSGSEFQTEGPKVRESMILKKKSQTGELMPWKGRPDGVIQKQFLPYLPNC